ncbi:MAG: hypothetical protein ACSLE7_17775 [Mycobacterium sp.]|jgi:hypothetical protein
MSTEHLMILLTGSLVLSIGISVVMVRFERRQRQVIARRRAAWIAGGSIPDEEPRFFGCCG